MNNPNVRTFLAALVGQRHRALPLGTPREAIDAALSGLEAEKYDEAGTPAFEVNNEYFRIGRRKLRVCCEDEMSFSLWGSPELVDQVYVAVLKKMGDQKR